VSRSPAALVRQSSAVKVHHYVQERTIFDVATTTISEARAALPEILSRVEAGEEVTITRHGRPVAVLVRPDTLAARRGAASIAAAERIGELLREARVAEIPVPSGVSAARAEELIAQIRMDRDAQ
jgi:antitoxin (DNA-binding transcriptional repressor) of toxin-antitoxin stability system